MTMVKAPNAVAFLLDEISRNDLIPEQIIVEFTEREVISRMDDFTDAVRKLKGAGINLAIDHFGAGFAGLSLLAQYQPDRIKIDHELIRNIHQDGPRQSIVQAIIKCLYFSGDCGLSRRVERAEEWMWLESAGISQFQGNLFASARLGGLPAVAWPEKK
ncbi:BLUF domain/cyclic diguanylate phosphodiesterase (EAL) domain protein [Klebsiella pneumoniae]|uniref:BLUF domain/cyclic diguanylate phosphodiesterase (EAL) domain protein n=1 Tax=Klebsiella pneumoniae TaxID=573 RepID=A0A4P0XZH1_KLEPN|nr:BLUF domain/cyclic diguanylate phosphodiesterase (EAL) domain protein [Klebsiella pneumoniae]